MQCATSYLQKHTCYDRKCDALEAKLAELRSSMPEIQELAHLKQQMSLQQVQKIYSFFIQKVYADVII
jgi:hypothetical protein